MYKLYVCIYKLYVCIYLYVNEMGVCHSTYVEVRQFTGSHFPLWNPKTELRFSEWGTKCLDPLSHLIGSFLPPSLLLPPSLSSFSSPSFLTSSLLPCFLPFFFSLYLLISFLFPFSLSFHFCFFFLLT